MVSCLVIITALDHVYAVKNLCCHFDVILTFTPHFHAQVQKVKCNITK